MTDTAAAINAGLNLTQPVCAGAAGDVQFDLAVQTAGVADPSAIIITGGATCTAGDAVGDMLPVNCSVAAGTSATAVFTGERGAEEHLRNACLLF